MTIRIPIQVVIVLVLLGIEIQPSYAQDVEGSSDHPLISRFPESVIKEYSYRDFDEYQIPLAKNYSNSKDVVEGKVTKICYTSKPGNSPAQVYRSYAMALEKAGFSELFSCKKRDCGLDVTMGMGKYSGGGALGKDCRYKATQLFERGDAAQIFC